MTSTKCDRGSLPTSVYQVDTYVIHIIKWTLSISILQAVKRHLGTGLLKLYMKLRYVAPLSMVDTRLFSFTAPTKNLGTRLHKY